MMAIPLLPAPLDARYDADGFRCVLRSRDVLLPPEVMAWVSIMTVSLAVSASATVGALLSDDFFGWIVLSCFAAAMLVGGRAALDLMLGAPRTTRLVCSHEALEIDERVLGVRHRRVRLPLGSIERCRAGREGLEIRHVVAGAPRHLLVETPCPGGEVERLAAEIERAAARRRRFERDRASAERTSARALLDLLLDQSESGNRKRETAGR